MKQDGFVDTGDMVELRDDRYYFVGRRGGIINVGGLKINPEEVEAVINRHPGVRLSRVSGRKNPITGAIVVAEVVLADAANDNATLQEEILARLPRQLAAFKVPAMLRFVPALELTRGRKAGASCVTYSGHRRLARRRPGHRPQAGGRRLSRLRPGAQGKRRR